MTVDELLVSLGQLLPLQWRADEETEEWILTLALEGVLKEIRLFAFEEEGHDMVRFLAPVAAADALSASRFRALLEWNATLSYGALAIFEGTVVVTSSAPLHRTNASEMADAVLYITRTASTFDPDSFMHDRTPP